jgi:hypothetical protein
MPEPSLSELDDRLKQLQAQLSAARSTSNLPVPVEDASAQVANQVHPTLPAHTRQADPIQQLDERIAKATPKEALALLIVRERLVTQTESQEDRKHVRSLERRNFYAKVALSFSAFAGGAGLVVGGFALPGFVCIGAGLYALAPSSIDRVTDRVLGRKKP